MRDTPIDMRHFVHGYDENNDDSVWASNKEILTKFFAKDKQSDFPWFQNSDICTNGTLLKYGDDVIGMKNRANNTIELCTEFSDIYNEIGLYMFIKESGMTFTVRYVRPWTLT